ncbi:Cu(I)/Ag(I) efflux RND transporter outer membrane protein [Intestinirhabdus alba]|jgi:Cu(I)/Ag(I) efflux system outer membrane protein|uniref:Efflux transporter outer membrane subunit n=1 Tax=Intestinirhabdus alba TaxID=2899544 RepID=A0A6L6ID80_9ENTR|nr:Cu(I)/Ag(I) efflux RND transporter outer membrane protein [Intestinirhabdus alba]MTH44812.1 efflux transporter outer membrane subunit [Intestinirhabdus alba]
MRTFRFFILGAAFILSGCSLAPAWQQPALPIPQRFSLSQNRLVDAPAAVQDVGWRRFFVDEQARALIDEALRNNRDLRMAALKVQEARAQYRVTDADRYPQLNAQGSGGWSGKLKSDADSVREYKAGLDLSVDFDLFGRLKNMSEAGRQRYFASEEARRAVHILLVANVARSYFSQRLAAAQLELARQTLRNDRQSYAFVEKQLLTGSANVLALAQARGVIDNARSEVARREGELAQANNALQLLLGSYGKLPDDRPAGEGDIRSVTLPPSLSSHILLQRPDIMEAERTLMAANADIGAARAAFFPSITLTSGLSAAGSDLSNLFSAAGGAWNFIPRLTLPIFNGGRNRANLELAEIRQRQAVVGYEQKIQNAFREVADALALRQSLADRTLDQQRYLASLQVTLQRARALYRHGAVSYIEVLDARRALFATRQALLDLNYARQANEITLFTALGGGWVE